jgi:hypothetical protein
MIASRRTTPAEWLEIATVTVLSHFRGTREILNPRPPRTYGLPSTGQMLSKLSTQRHARAKLMELN